MHTWTSPSENEKAPGSGMPRSSVLFNSAFNGRVGVEAGEVETRDHSSKATPSYAQYLWVLQ